MTVDPAHLESLWDAVSARKSTAAFRTSELGMESTNGPLLAAVDRDGRRCLLVPISARQTLKEDIDGQAVVLSRRVLEDEKSYRAYACLQLVDGRFNDLFAALCSEIADRVAASPDRAVAAMKKVLSDWRALLSGTREAMSPTALAGLFGELHVLKQMLRVDSGAVAFWTGPTGSAQDFHRGSDAIEVKTTLLPEGRRVHINGIGQLDIAPPGRLVLRWFRLRSDRGLSVPALVDEIADLADDVPAFRGLLAEYGYRENEREIYERRRFEVTEERAYEVGPGFPRIVGGCLVDDALLAGVGPIDYVVDLDSGPAEAARLSEYELVGTEGSS